MRQRERERETERKRERGQVKKTSQENTSGGLIG